MTNIENLKAFDPFADAAKAELQRRFFEDFGGRQLILNP